MRPEKQLIAKEYARRLNASPFFLVVDYKGLTVGQFTELRKRLSKTGSEVHVVKNSMFRIAVKEAGVADLAGTLAGQVAVVTGQREISSAAKALKTFQSEFEKPKLKFGYLNNQRLETAELMALADLPPIEQLRAEIVGLIEAPVASLLSVLEAPARELVYTLQAWIDQQDNPKT